MSKLSHKKFNCPTPDESPGFLLWQVGTIWHRNINKVLKKFNLTHAQFVVMATVFWFMDQKTPATQIQIAHLSKIDPVVVSNVLKTLDKKALTKRKESSDLRAKDVMLTQKGKEILTPALHAVELFDETFFGGLNNLPMAKKMMQTLIKEN